MRFSFLAAGALAVATVLPAQQPAPTRAAGPTLTLDEALQLARRNNPTFLTSVNQRRNAAANVRRRDFTMQESFPPGNPRDGATVSSPRTDE